jgi:hypothetical protein
MNFVICSIKAVRYKFYKGGLSSMQELRLTIKKRAFPSKGRVRLNVAQLSDLEVLEGEHVDLINETTKKTVKVAVIADTMVPAGQIRVSEEDLAALGLQDKEEVLVKKTPPLMDKLKKTGDDVKKGAVKAGSDVKKAVTKPKKDL